MNWLVSADANAAVARVIHSRPEQYAQHALAEALVSKLGIWFDAPAMLAWAVPDPSGNVPVKAGLSGLTFHRLPDMLIVRVDAESVAGTAAHEYGHSLVLRGLAYPGKALRDGQCDRLAVRMGDHTRRLIRQGSDGGTIAACLYAKFRPELKGATA